MACYTGSEPAVTTLNIYVNTQNDGLSDGLRPWRSNSIQGATATRNYSDPQYGHKFDVDAPPGTGDLFYGGFWHTWLVGGLGPGGKAIYALDDSIRQHVLRAKQLAAVVMGEWDSTNITCTNLSNCKNSLGNTYGVPLIRRFHNGNWGAIFGNGYMAVPQSRCRYLRDAGELSGAISFYRLL